jgi:hypothetical protein
MTPAVLTQTIYPTERLSLYTRIGDALPVAGLTLSLLSLILAVAHHLKDRKIHGRSRQIV